MSPTPGEAILEADDWGVQIERYPRRQRAYWRATLRLTSILLLAWAAASLLPGWFAEDLNAYSFHGWPLGFYMGSPPPSTTTTP